MTIGFRFRPSDREIINDYLSKRIDGHDYSYVIRDIDLCRHEPWELPGVSVLEDEEVWYFFCRPEYKYKNSKRANRATGSGFWKPTGKVRPVKGRGGAVIGTKKTSVFYAKTGSGSVSVRRNTWVIHEYQVQNVLPGQREFVFCKLKDKSDERTDSSAFEETEQDIQTGFEAGCITPSASTALGEYIARIKQVLDASDSESDLNGVSAMGRKAVDSQGMSADYLLQLNRLLSESREDKVDPLFPDSLLTEPEESVEHSHSPLATGVAHGGSSGMNDLHTSPRQFWQAARVQTIYESLPRSSHDVNQSRVKVPKTITLQSIHESSELSASYRKYQAKEYKRRNYPDEKKVFPVQEKTSFRNTKKSCVTSRNTVESHRPTPPFVYMVNVIVGLVFEIDWRLVKLIFLL